MVKFMQDFYAGLSLYTRIFPHRTLDHIILYGKM
jgi:hypothetical protein